VTCAAFRTTSSISPAAEYDSIIYQAQKVLKARGYDPGKPDGLWGKATERAVKYFQIDNNLPVSGKLDEQTKAKLGIVSTERGLKLSQPVGEKRLALVIGNSAYKTAPLRNPVNDAKDMSNALKVLGFKVLQKIDADRKEMEDAIRQFGRQLRGGGVGLFYYAGHGIQVKGRNYLIPIGARIESASDTRYYTVDAGLILGKMEDAKNDLNIVILDACRNNPFTRSFRSADTGLAKMDAPQGSLVAYATEPGSVAADGEGRNGIYTKYLLKHMKTPGLTIERILKKVRIDVRKETEGQQTPWESSSLIGDFYFASVVNPVPKSSMELANERAKLERKRLELEGLKLDIEREKLEAERKRLAKEQQEREKLESERIRVEEEQKKKTVIASIDPKDREIGQDTTLIQDESKFQKNKWKTIIVEGEQVIVGINDHNLDAITALKEKKYSESIIFSVNNRKDMQPLLIKAKGKLIRIDDQWFARFEYLDAQINPKVRESSYVEYIRIGLVWYYKSAKYSRWHGKYAREFSKSGTLPFSRDINRKNSFIKKSFWVKLADPPRHYQNDRRFGTEYSKLIKPHIFIAFHSEDKNYILTTSKNKGFFAF